MFVFVCSHYFEPLVPDTINIERFHGLQLHSHDYRQPDDFKGRTVLVFGAGPSGTDIANDISPFVKKVRPSNPLL